jgi:uncharacterized DUF497 family protein
VGSGVLKGGEQHLRQERGRDQSRDVRQPRVRKTISRLSRADGNVVARAASPDRERLRLLGSYRASLQREIYCSTLRRVRFVWDARKAAANLRKHGVSFEEASTAFDDELGAFYPDSLHENRFILIGYSRQQRLLYVVHAEVRPDAIRIISARKATKHEKTRYEND